MTESIPAVDEDHIRREELEVKNSCLELMIGRVVVVAGEGFLGMGAIFEADSAPCCSW
jgi:hypothetical protein